MKIIPYIVEQHAEEAAYNWIVRDGAVTEPPYDVNDLTQLDNRIEANINGLRISADPGWEICKDALATEEPGEIFTAGVLAFESLIPKRMDAMLASVAADDALKRALVSALGWIDFNHISEPMQRLLSADVAFLKYLGLAAHAVHRRDPGAVLGQLLDDEDPLVRYRALKAAGELGRMDLVSVMGSHLKEEDITCRFYAAWSLVLLGESSGLAFLGKQVAEASEYAQRAGDMVARTLDPPKVLQWLAQLTQQPELLRFAILGYGSLGDPAAVPWLLTMMKTPATARPAGEAFSMITGVDMSYENLDGEEPEGFEAGPTENSEDDDVDMDPDEDLPWPEPELVENWWTEHRNHFHSGTRYLCGKPISPEQCKHVLQHGYQRQRAAAALELALMKPDRPLFEIRAPGFVQQRLLGIR